MTKPDEIAPFYQLSAVYHTYIYVCMFLVPKNIDWTCGAILEYPNFDSFYPQSPISRSDCTIPLTKRVQLEMCPSSWKLYLDGFPFSVSFLAHLEPKLELFELWEIML